MQLDAEVKPQEGSLAVRNSGGMFTINKNFIKRSIFIDKADVSKMISYIQRDIIPNLKSSYKKNLKNMFLKIKNFSFLF